VGKDSVKIEFHDRRVTIEVTGTEISELPSLVKGLVLHDQTQSVPVTPASEQLNNVNPGPGGFRRALTQLVVFVAKAFAKCPSLLHRITNLFR
jgi:hypothetical protein